MSRYELTKVWILLILLPLSNSLENNSRIIPAEEAFRPRVENITDATKYEPTVIVGCESVIDRGLPSGIYRLGEPYLTKMNWIWDTFEVYCEKAAGVGWIVIQRRGEFGGHRENFARSWDDYARGFGDLHGEFWLGNEWIHRLTSDVGAHDLRIELENWEGQKSWAQYSNFKIGPETNSYRLLLATTNKSSFTRNATDSLSDRYYQSFVTSCCDYRSNGVPRYVGGWWRHSEGHIYGPNPNSPYDGEYEEAKILGMGHSFKSAKMMLRSRHYRSLYKFKSTNQL